MKKRMAVLVALMASLLVLSLANAPATASGGNKKPRIDGVWCYIPVMEALTPIAYGANNEFPGDDDPGDKIFVTTFENAEWTGVFEGESRDYGVIVADPVAGNPPVAPKTFAASIVFDSVKVKGVEGGMELDVHGGYRRGQWEGGFTINSGTGRLSDVQGHGKWWGPGYNVDKPDECGVIYYKVQQLRGLGRHRTR